jgi:hypothetical protein
MRKGSYNLLIAPLIKYQEIGSDHLALVAEFAFVDDELREPDNEDARSNDSSEASTEYATSS